MAVKNDEIKEIAPEKPATRMIQLYKDAEHKDDYVVCLNGKTYTIKRGVKVEVPEGVAEIIDNQERMDALAVERQEAAMHKFA